MLALLLLALSALGCDSLPGRSGPKTSFDANAAMQ